MTIWGSYWLLPLLFMFHDFEELVFVPHWLQKNNPNIYGRTLFGGVDRSDILSAGIWEEFCIYIALSAIAYWINYPLLIVAATIPYFLHLIMHIVFSLIKRTYVPGVVTAIVEIPVTIAYLLNLIKLTYSPLWQWIVVIFIMFVFFIGNLKLIHWLMAKVAGKLSA
ncbi:HXXEE domain-containing protein [Liquorilactobacillus mali]|uniref:HXXEE domain-containing protein n=1 Tax=Liquorilactobacillus mali TaxID=1618 RepID=UPI0029535495|nr:HXXEE domain-containing protein [Liquorilactobacillus mali]MDV7757544.1 HXXEE domain-containing protein [Liquorilactobacillus mali]